MTISILSYSNVIDDHALGWPRLGPIQETLPPLPFWQLTRIDASEFCWERNSDHWCSHDSAGRKLGPWSEVCLSLYQIPRVLLNSGGSNSHVVWVCGLSFLILLGMGVVPALSTDSVQSRFVHGMVRAVPVFKHLTVPLWKWYLFCFILLKGVVPSSGFGSWKTVLTVLVPLSSFWKRAWCDLLSACC